MSRETLPPVECNTPNSRYAAYLESRSIVFCPYAQVSPSSKCFYELQLMVTNVSSSHGSCDPPSTVTCVDNTFVYSADTVAERAVSWTLAMMAMAMVVSVTAS